MKKILIIEDEEILLQTMAAKLRRAGYEVAEAHTGELGIDAVRAENPDLILLDILLPEKDGYQVLEELHGNEDLRSIPIIIISNSGQTVDLDRAKRFGARDYLIKANFDPEDVLTKVRSFIGEGSDAAPAAVPVSDEPTGASQAESVGGRIDVLVVEDNQLLSGIIVNKIQSGGFTAELVENGGQVVQTAEQKQPRLILLDLILPDVDGLTILEQLKKNPHTQEIPVVILSNLSKTEDMDKAVQLGAIEYLIKAHYGPEEILGKVRTFLQKS